MSSALSYHVFRFPRLLVACASTTTPPHPTTGVTPLPCTASVARAAVLFFSVSTAVGLVFGFNLRGSCPAHDHTHTHTHTSARAQTHKHWQTPIHSGPTVAPKYDSETQTRQTEGFRMPLSKETAEAA